MERNEIYLEIKNCSKYQYFDITYKGNESWELVKDTVKLIDIDDNYIKVGGVGFQYTLPLEKVVYVDDPNDVVLKYRLKSEYLNNSDDNISLILFKGLAKLFNGDTEKASKFVLGY